MIKPAYIFLVLLPAFSSSAMAQYSMGAVDLRSGSPQYFQADPGSIVTASFLIFNRSEKEGTFGEKLELPAGVDVEIKQ